jgi:BirA family transcriptional regulator, biotin operon repressor / biotin---[acetyl-CoA-carboxylase] ligase
LSTEPVPPGLWPEGYDRVILDEVDSTMAEAARRAHDLDGPTWIMAHRQTAARGRRGRVWQQPAGNLAATLIYKPWATVPDAAKRSFLAANALFEALALFVDRTALSLKWPNDVLLNGGKVAGILLESAGRGGRMVDWLAVGVGVNLTGVPADLTERFRAVSLAGEGGATVSPEDFLTVLASAYATQESKLAVMGFQRIREDWLRHAAKLGETITARTMRDEHSGIFDTVDMDGNLVLITGTGPLIIPAADVFF